MNRVRRAFLLSLGLLMTVYASAQIQKGYVKTKGRMGKNGVIAGSPIPGASVILRGGNSTVSGNNGTFSLTVPSKKFSLQNVLKKNYVLTDPDILSKQYDYSTNLLTIVLETTSQQLEDKLAAHDKICETLRSRLKKKEEEIKALKEQNKVTQEEYLKLRTALIEEQDDNEKLIGQMAERYSKIDFDEVDDSNKAISRLILEGKLSEADSLLNTKGDIHTRADELKRLQQMAQKKMAELGQDCYTKYEIFMMKHLKDSAEYYIEYRLNIDSTNYEWQNDAGHFAREYRADYAKAMRYYEKGLQLAKTQDGERGLSAATCYNNIGNLMYEKGDYDQALKYYQIALEIKETALGQDNQGVATYLNNIGNAYTAKRDYSMALDYHKRALAIRESLLGTDHPDVAGSYNNIAAIYRNQKDYAQAIKYSMARSSSPIY